MEQQDKVDIFVVGGGVNGVAIARDAVGRGLSVHLAEMGDLAGATSSASTKLFHGGLRYLEYFEFRLVRKALVEREVLLKNMPHISWPMRFVLPMDPEMRFDGETPTSKLLRIVMPWMKGRRPAWLIRLGLFIYDHLGGRKILPATAKLDLREGVEGLPLRAGFSGAYEYSDCWVDDARLVALMARDAKMRGAVIETRTQVIATKRHSDHWEITTQNGAGVTATVIANTLVNAAGPWVEKIIKDVVELDNSASVRLVRGSHIVTDRLFDHNKAYFFQGRDGRIIFAIPYQQDFTLIGTTDAPHDNPDMKPECTDEEAQYLCDFVSEYFKKPVTTKDIIWRYAGVRPLYDDGATSATAATREFVLTLRVEEGAPLLNVFGGKITTHRVLAEKALEKLTPYHDMTPAWTHDAALPGGDFDVSGVDDLRAGLVRDFAFMDAKTIDRMVRAFGTEVRDILAGATSLADLGEDFGGGLYAREVDWMITHEFAQTAHDVLWRRSKLGLVVDLNAAQALQSYMEKGAI